MKNNKFGRGINSWAAEALEQAEKNGTVLSPHAKGLLKTLNAVDPLFAYGWNGLETAAEGGLIGGGLGYLSGGQEGMYSGIGAGIAMGAVGGTAGKMVADVTGGTNVARRAVQAKMVIEGHKVTNPDKAMFFQAMQTAAEARGKDVDLVNGIIAGIDKVAPNFEFHALTPDQFYAEAKRKGYDPTTGKFKELSALDSEFGGDRASKSKAVGILRSVGGDFVGDRAGFLDALKKASAKDSANPNKPASNIPLALRKYTDVAKTFEKLTKTQQEAVLKEIDGQGELSKELGGATKLRDHYDTLTWAEGWTDQLVKKFETDREGSRKDITEMLAQETGKDGKLNRKGRALADKLRAEGFLDRDNKLLRERNLLQADLTISQFAFSKGAVIGRESDGKTHMYINLNSMGNETFPHELFHTIMRESPMKKHFTDSLISKLLGTVDKDGKLVRPAEVNIGQVQKFFKKYIDLTHRNDDGTLDVQASEAKFKLVQEALAEYQNAGSNKQISDKARGLLEHYSEEFGAYYFSHWLMGRNRNTLFFGGELKGIEGLVERTKDSFKDFWQSKVSKSNPEFDFSNGLNEAFDRSKGLGRIASVDYYMRDMVRAASNANREAFRPDSMTLDNLRDFERSNGLRNLTTPDGNRRLNPREQVTQNIRLGKEAFKILSGVDKAMRTSKDVIDENGKQVITGRLSETELDALVKGGIVPRAWADKVNQGYAMLDGTISNVFSAGYLGKTEQTTDASYPRLTGKDVAFKNRKAVLFDVETKIKADGTFYTLFHTLDLAVIEQEANRLFQNTDYRALFDGDRAVMEADFFRYLSNASKASTDTTKLDSAVLLDKGDGLGAKRRDVLHQMGRMALQTGDAYKHQPIAVIPEGFRHSVTTFNIDGMTTPRVETGARYDINMKNAHKFIRENWQPVDMVQEKTPSGVIMKHDSGFKFVRDASGSVSAYSPNGDRIGKFGSIREATVAAKNKFHKVHDNFDADLKKQQSERDRNAAKFQALEVSEREEAIRSGDLFSLQKVKDFIGNRKVLRQTREEFIVSKAYEALNDPLLIEKAADDVINRNKQVLDDYADLRINLEKIENELTASVDKTRELLDLFSRTQDQDQRNIIGAEESANKTRQIELRNASRKAVEAMGKMKDEFKKSRMEAFADIYWVYKNKPKQHFLDSLRHGIEQAIGATPWDTANNKRGLLNGRKINESLPRKAHSGLQETLFAGEFDSQMKTGEPIVVIGTHGTRNVALMLSRILLDDKLGERYGQTAYSATLGHFMGGSTDTSAAYADAANSYFLQQGVSVDELRNYIGGNYENGKQLGSSVARFQMHLQDVRNKQLERVDAIVAELLGITEGSENLGFKEKSKLHLEALAILDFQKTKKYIGDYYYGKLYEKIENIYSQSQFPELKPTFDSHFYYKDFGNGLRETMTDDVSIQYGFRIDRKQLVGLNAKVPFDMIRFADEHIAVNYDERLYNAVISDARDLIKTLSADENYVGGSDRTRFFRNLEIAEAGRKYYEEQRAAGVKEEDLLLPKQQLRMMMAFDNPKVIVDPRGYDEKKLAPQMLDAINAGHDGIIFKRLADGGAMDDIYIQIKGNQDKILTIDSAFDPHHIPRKDENGNTLKTGRDLKLSLQPNEVNVEAQVKGIQLDMTKAYDVFRQEYEQSTGQAWSKDKFMQRAKGWQFFGDENGFVAVRPQRSGFVKLVGMAGDNKSKLRAIQQIKELKLPVWGMVSEDIKNIAVRRGMREPNFFERTALKYALNSAALGDAQILGYTADGGVRLKYPDIGEVTKYMIGSPEYYQKLRSQFGEQVKNKIGFQPDEVSQGGRKYDPASEEFRTKFIGKWAEENPDRLKGYDLEFIDRGTKYGTHNVRIRLQDNSTVGMTQDVGHITADIDPKTKVASLSSNIGVKYRGNKLSYALYSEMAERLRSMGIEKVDGTIVNPEGIPIKVREKIIGNTRVLRSNGSSGLPIDYKQGARIIQRRQADGVVGTWGLGLDVVNELDFNARYQPTDYQGGDDYYKPKKNIFESRDDQGLLVRRASIGNDELTGDKEARGSKLNPDYVGWEDIGHYPQTGETKADNVWEAKNSGLWYWKDDKGVKTKNPMWDNDNPSYTHAEWFDRAFQYEDDKPTIYGRYEKPKYDKKGNLTEKGRISISSNYRGEVKDMADANFYKETVASSLGVPADHIDAYLFSANDKVKSQMGYGLKDQLAIKFQPAEEIGIQATEGFKWFKRNKYNNIPKEREIVIDKILTDVFENKMSYAEAAKANNENRVNVAKLVNNYVKNNPSARSLIPSETIKNHQFKWYVPDTEAHAYPLSKAVKIDEAMDDVISKSMLIKDSAKKHSIDIDVLTYAISNARERGSQFENQLGGVGSNTRSKELYSLNKETGRMKISEENRKAIQSMYFDEGYSQKQVAESFGISKAIVQDILKENNRTSKNLQPDELIQNGFEKSELNEKLLDSKHIVLGFDERILEGKAVVINNPDMMMTGELKTNDGRTLIEGEGGLNFVAKFGDVWANSVKPKAETTASKLRQSQKENNGVAYLALTRGELTKALNSHTGAKGAMAILEYFVEQGYISLEEFRNALKDSGRKYGINFNATKSAKDIHAEIAQKFFGIEDSSFEKRGFFVTDVITHLAKKGKSGNENIAKIREALGSDRLGRTIKFKAKGIKEAIGLMISDKRANVEPSHVYAYIEVTGNISVEKTENGHKSYPYHIVQRDENGNKIRPRMLIPDKTNYVTDVILDSNKDVVPRLVKDKNGRNMSGAVMLGSNKVGEAVGYVRPAKDIPEGKPRLKWQPSEYSEFKSEQSATGRILRNAKGYVIMLANNKFRVYNPAKAIIGVYGNEEEAKKRIYKEIPKR